MSDLFRCAMILGFLLLNPACQKSADPGAGSDPADLLPMDNDISGFSRKGGASVMTDYQSIMDAIDGAAEKYIDYGFVEGVQQGYTNGTVDIDVRIFNQGTENNAVGIFQEFYPSSAEIITQENPRIVVDHSLLLNYSIYYQKDNIFTEIHTNDKTDFALSMAKQFCLNIDAKINLE